jgi:transcriptional regulator with XRE-family HTH domain
MIDVDSGRDFASIGARLELLREWRGAKQKDMAAMAGVTPQAWNNWIRGRARPDIEQVWDLCRETGVTSDYIYFGDRSGLPLRFVEWLVSGRDQSKSGNARRLIDKI